MIDETHFWVTSSILFIFLVFVLVILIQPFNTNPRNRIERIFLELKLKGLVKKSRIIDFCICDQAFSSSLITRKIYCDCTFRIPRDPNCIRFCLLHEEAHLRNFQYRYLLILIYMIEIGVVFLFSQLMKFSSLNVVFILAFAIVLFFGILCLIFIPFRLCYPLFRKDEFNSDLFGAIGLKRKYWVDEPSKMVHEALIIYQSDEYKGTKKSGNNEKISDFITKFLSGYYPTIDKRTLFIVATVDQKSFSSSF
jgi:hypothetical protein